MEVPTGYKVQDLHFKILEFLLKYMNVVLSKSYGLSIYFKLIETNGPLDIKAINGPLDI